MLALKQTKQWNRTMNNKNKKNKSERLYMIELMIVVAVIGVLATVQSPNTKNYMQKNLKPHQGLATHIKLVTNIDNFHAENGTFQQMLGMWAELQI
ncbi:hypothetical protein O9992_06045 [Vibrio lentus]|nr:hypothetical protein [Vibrio lentus]